jgi:hypothetical protein
MERSSRRLEKTARFVVNSMVLKAETKKKNTHASI